MIEGASAIARRFKVSDLFIGLTIVAIGTSLPEFVINVTSAARGNTALALGNILGSNIANILLILGCAALIRPLVIKSRVQFREIPLGILAAALVLICGLDRALDRSGSDVISRTDGLILLCFFSIFMYYTVRSARAGDAAAVNKPRPIWLAALLFAGGLGGLILGGSWFVDGASRIARAFGMSDAMIGLTIVAIGTSLPELATSLVAAGKKNTDLAVGNIIGSNIMNIFLILGTTAVIQPIDLPAGIHADIIVSLFSALLLFAATFMIGRRRIVRSEGLIFLSLYAVYLVFQVIR
jgi:cation:H+ antiporter